MGNRQENYLWIDILFVFPSFPEIKFSNKRTSIFLTTQAEGC
jgi:hypothetical protein